MSMSMEKEIKENFTTERKRERAIMSPSGKKEGSLGR